MNPWVAKSFDEYVEAMRHTDARVTISGRERQPWVMWVCDIDGVGVRWAQDGAPNVFEGAINADAVGVLLGIDAAGKLNGNGVTFRADSAMVVPARRSVRTASIDAVTWMSVVIPTERLARSEEEKVAFQSAPCSVIETANDEVARLRDVLGRIVEAGMNDAFASNADGQRDAAQQLIAATRALLDPAATPCNRSTRVGRHRIGREEIIARVQRFLAKHEGEHVSLSELAAAADVSDRTLHNVFREEFGVSPKRLLRLRMLNQARSELMSADPAQTRVTDVATRFGFWEWGRFSRDYQSLFGELPSQTLHRHRR